MAQLKDLLVAGPSRLIGDTVLSAGATSEGDIIPSESGKHLGASGKTWNGQYITNTTGASTGNYGDSANQTPGYGGTFNVPYIQVDANGRISNISSHTVKIPASDNANTATAADNILKGSNSGTQITYAPYTAKQTGLSFYTGNTVPDGTTRLNLNGYLYATKLYSGGNEVLTSHQSLPNGSISGSPGAANTITSFSQSNGQVSASFGAIAIASSQITSGIVDLTAKGTIGWEGNSSTTTNKYLVDRNAIAYWNGAYSGTSSNLTYCTKGAFGDLAVINKPTSNTTTTFLRGDGTWQTALTSHQSLANYVTLNGAETISGAKTFSAVLKATNSNGVEAQKFQINDSSNANKAYWQYNSTDACVDLVFN